MQWKLQIDGVISSNHALGVAKLLWWDPAKQTAANGKYWPVAGAPADEIDATLLTFKSISDRPVWSEQFRDSAVSDRPSATARTTPSEPTVGADCALVSATSGPSGRFELLSKN